MPELIYGSSGDCRLELGNPAEAEVSASLLNTSRRRATRVINSYLERAYPGQIPFSASGDVPELLNSLNDDLSTYYVKRALHHGPSPLSDTIKEEYYDKSIKLLEEIRDGELVISELAGKVGDIGIATQSKYTPTFSDEKDELNWQIDPDKSDT